jgi:hypothetical protein
MSGSETEPPEANPPVPPHANITFPPGSTTVDVRIINTSTTRREQARNLFSPEVPGFKHLVFPSHSFLITHQHPTFTEPTHLLFDLSIRKDWATGFPPIFHPLFAPQKDSSTPRFDLSVSTDVPSILSSNSSFPVALTSISAVIWSHHHFDLRGDVSLFPATTSLVLGPGLLSTYNDDLYPNNPDGDLASSDFEGREIRQLSEKDFTLCIGGFPALDFFGDGSLYILSAEGHTAGHIAALARVSIVSESSESSSSPKIDQSSTQQGDEEGWPTMRSTFVLMAGDSAHHPAVFRPSPYLPLPETISLTEIPENDIHHQKTPVAGSSSRVAASIYSGSKIISHLHPTHSHNTSFLRPDSEPMCHNTQATSATVEKLQLFDAHDDVLVCIAHDSTLLGHVPVFPERLKEWKVLRLKEQVTWEFLRDFDIDCCKV